MTVNIMDRIGQMQVIFPGATGIPEINKFHAPILLLGIVQILCTSSCAVSSIPHFSSIESNVHMHSIPLLYLVYKTKSKGNVNIMCRL